MSDGMSCVSFSSHSIPPPPAYCPIEYLNQEEVLEVVVTLKAEPTSGLAPLSVKFTSTAKAIIHYADEIYGGSVDGPALTKEKKLTPNKPPDQIIKEAGVKVFTATAEYGGKEGKATVMVVATKTDTDCDKVRKEWLQAVRDAEGARHSYNNAKADADRLGEMLANPAATIEDFEMRINTLKNLLKPDTSQESRDLILKAIAHLEAELNYFRNNISELKNQLQKLKDTAEKLRKEYEEKKKKAEDLYEQHPECFPLA